MEKRAIYLDYAATTAMEEAVVREMLPYFTQDYGNASSVHEPGSRAKQALTRARRQVAALIGADPSEIFFTSGGTEADNWALWGAVNMGGQESPHLITTRIEHHAILHTCEALQQREVEVTYLKPDALGLVSPEAVEQAIRSNTVLISVMYANNEVGTLQPVEEIAQVAARHGILFHTDAVQAVGHLPIQVHGAGKIDLLSCSAHKLGGPKGVGFLYLSRELSYGFPPLLFGGGQERGRRAGTENIPGIVGFGAAAQQAMTGMKERAEAERGMRDHLIRRVLTEIPGASLNGHPALRLPGNASFCFEGIEGETLQTLLDLYGVYGSGGSACSSGSLEPSHVLLAMEIPRELARSALRLTLGSRTTMQEIDDAVDILKMVLAKHLIR